MSKGSGRRRITPSDGLQYNAETDMTNIEERGGSHRQSAKKELLLGIRTGAPPTKDNDYGSHSGTGDNGRYAGKGRKNDHRNWKGYTGGKQYDHNARTQEAVTTHKPVPEAVAERMREKSINADVQQGFPCKAWSRGTKISVSISERAWEPPLRDKPKRSMYRQNYHPSRSQSS
jgi:hypothetical protein